jgi:hypothetical protein
MTGYPLFVDYQYGRLVQAKTGGDTLSALRAIEQGDGTPIDVCILDSVGTLTSRRVTARPVTDYTLRVGLYLKSNLSTQLAFQNTFTDDLGNNVKQGFLVQDSAAVTTALGSENSVDVGLSVEISGDGGAHYETVISAVLNTLKLTRNTIGSGTLTAPPNETPLTVENSQSVILNALRYGFPLENSTTGEVRLVYLDDSGQIQGKPVPQ